MLERDIERHLVKRVKELGGEVRKVVWSGHKGAPDRLVMLPPVPGRPSEIVENGDGTLTYLSRQQGKFARTIWIELKNPDTVKTFPANPHERAQRREHERLRKMGQRVEVIGTIEQIEGLLA